MFAGDQPLSASRNDYDWLGDGIYFWEHNASRAFSFARDMAKRPHPSGQKIKGPAVVGAVIDLGRCLNLLDEEHIGLVKSAHELLVAATEQTDVSLPRNSGGPDRFDRKLDCEVLRTLHKFREQEGDEPFDTVRAAFFEGQPLYEQAGFAAKSHIQIAVRDQACIVGYFRPLTAAGRARKFR